jgi:hypothetical protein
MTERTPVNTWIHQVLSSMYNVYIKIAAVLYMSIFTF